MRFNPPLRAGHLIRRYKRFLADVEVDGECVTMHCPNTGSMQGCADPGSEVWFSHSDNPRRKYAHTLEAVCTRSGTVGVNTALANRLVAEALHGDVLEPLNGYSACTPEVPVPDEKGRFDFSLSNDRRRLCYVEVKSVTLHVGDGLGAFPDAVSARATRHVEALQRRTEAGERAVLLFCVRHDGVAEVTVADAIDPDYGAAVRRAVAAGVEVLACAVHTTRTRARVTSMLPVTGIL